MRDVPGLAIQIRVVGETASAKPTAWGVYTWDGTRWIALRSKPSRFPIMRRMNPNGAHIIFDRLAHAKDYANRLFEAHLKGKP